MTSARSTEAAHMRTFYVLLATQVLSLVGSRISGLAVGIWVYTQTGNATPLTLVAFFAAIPMVLATTFSGVMADRWDRRKVIMLADAGQALGTVLLLVSFLSGSFQLWHLYTVAVIQAVFGVFQSPAFQASVTLLVPEEKRDRANAIQQMASPSAGLIAPAVAGVIYAMVGVEGAIAVDLFTFAVAIAVISFVRIPRPPVSEEGLAMAGTVWKEALGGLRYLWSKGTLLFLVLFIACVNFLVGGAMVLATPYILARTGSEEVLGILLSVMNAGGIVGALIMSVWGGTRPRIHTVMPGLLIGGIFLATLGLGRHPLALGASLFGLMFPIPFVNAAFLSMMQAKVPPDIQGRVFAVVQQFAMVLMPLAYLAAGPLADRVFEPAVGGPGWQRVAPLVGDGVGSGIGLIMLIFGTVTAVSSLAVYTLPHVRGLESRLKDYEAAPPETGTDQPELPLSYSFAARPQEPEKATSESSLRLRGEESPSGGSSMSA